MNTRRQEYKKTIRQDESPATEFQAYNRTTSPKNIYKFSNLL